MYGLVNNAIRQQVIDQEGEAAWKEIVAQAQLDIPEFDALTLYDDSTTIALVSSIAAVRECEVATVLKEIGCYWIQYASTTSFANLLTLAGNDFEQVIAGHDDMHKVMKLSLTESTPPSFSIRRLDDGRFEISYKSERAGLFPFVDGLFEGLAHRCNQKVTILEFEQLSSSSAKWIMQVEAASNQAA
ncbi:MAG: heme NO-binding domain-containing protein [Geminicoccaceae bacterium]